MKSAQAVDASISHLATGHRITDFQAFSDWIITSPLVRLELSILHAPKTDGQQPQSTPSERRFMSINDYLAAFGMTGTKIRTFVTSGFQAPAQEATTQTLAA